ncbi:MAG TPA: PHP domain-containing protein, partial [Methanocella sp.]|nr:PHP domain-containing protein [Methanocella sp.]
SRGGHNMTNGHVAAVAKEAGAMLVVDTDTHGPGDLITSARALAVALGAGLSRRGADEAMKNALHKLDYIISRR